MAIPLPKLAGSVAKQPGLFSGINRKSAIWKTKRVDLKNVDSNLLGYVCKDGTINFSSQKAAIEYAKNKIAPAAARGYENAVGIKGNRVVFQVNGEKTSVMRPSDRLFDIGLHGHPDAYAKGCTAAPSQQDYMLLMKNPFQKKEIVFNSRGEYYSLTKLPSYNYDAHAHFRDEKFFEYIRDVGKIELKNAPRAVRSQFLEAQKRKDIYDMAEILDEKVYLENSKAVSEGAVKLSHEFWQKYAEKLGVAVKTNFSNFK